MGENGEVIVLGDNIPFPYRATGLGLVVSDLSDISASGRYAAAYCVLRY